MRMHKFLSLSLLSSLFFTTQYLHTSDAASPTDHGYTLDLTSTTGSPNPFDKNKLEFYCCTAHYPWDIVNLISERYFTNIDQKTHDEFRTKFVFQLSQLLIDRHQEYLRSSRKSHIAGDFFYHTGEIDPASHFTDLGRLKAHHKDKRFLQLKTYKIVAVNEQPTQTFIKTHEALPFDEAVPALMQKLKHLTLTVEPCEPNPSGKLASLDWSV